MKRFAWILILTSIAVAQTKTRDESKKPLTLASQGSFFVGGEYEDHARRRTRRCQARSPSTRCTCSIRSR